MQTTRLFTLARTARPLYTITRTLHTSRKLFANTTSPQDPNTPNTPASQTTGNPPKSMQKPQSESGGGGGGGDDVHLAKQPDTQEKPTSSTGIGGDEAVKPSDPAGENKQKGQ